MAISWMRQSDTKRLPSQVQMHVGQGVVTTVDNSDEKSPEQMLPSKVKLHLTTLGQGHSRTDRRWLMVSPPVNYSPAHRALTNQTKYKITCFPAKVQAKVIVCQSSLS